MKTFTIDTENNITAYGFAEEAAAASATPLDSFASQKDLAGLVAGWSAERLVATWNGPPGVEPVKRFKNSNACQRNGGPGWLNNRQTFLLPISTNIVPLALAGGLSQSGTASEDCG
jgi:hypothetical protein